MRLSLLVLAGWLATASPAAGQGASRDWRPAERAIIGDFSRITAIATSLDRVYVASPTSLIVLQPQFRRWDGPYSPADPAVLSGVFSALVDPLDQSLWLARSDGWVHFQPELELWDVGRAGQSVLSIAFDESDPVSGLFLRTRQGWYEVPRGGMVATPSSGPARPVTPTSVQDALRSNPALQANAAQILMDERLRTVRYTAAARAADNSGWYLGTAGVGLLFLPDGSALPERIPFGLPSPLVAAVMSWPGGVWVATNRTAQTDAALSFVGEELAEFTTLRGPPAIGIPFTQVADLAGAGRAVYAATDHGLARVDPGDGRYHMIDERLGLPDSRVFSVAVRQGRITVGTARGIARVDDTLGVERLAPGFFDAALAVFPVGDSVWVGTRRGMLLALPGERDLVRPAALASPSLQAPIVAVEALADTIVALTADHLVWRDPRTGGWNIGPNLSALLGRLRAFAADGAGFWVAGDRGAGFARLNTPAVRALQDGDVPGNITGLAVDREYLWVGTTAGLARFRLDAIRP